MESKQANEDDSKAVNVEDLQTLFETRIDFLKKEVVSSSSSSSSSFTSASSNALSYSIANKTSSTYYTYRSAFSPECEFTNWNNDFQGTLDYVFVSEDIKIGNSQLLSSIDHLPKKCKRLRKLTPLIIEEKAFVGSISDSNDCGSSSDDDDNDYGTQEALRNGPFPSTKWPSDHLLLLTTITDINSNHDDAEAPSFVTGQMR